MIQPDETWKEITKQTLHKLDEITRIKLITYIMQSDIIGTAFSCIDTFNWRKTNEGYEYWHKLHSSSLFTYKHVEITEIQKFIQSLYTRETYPEYYL